MKRCTQKSSRKISYLASSPAGEIKMSKSFKFNPYTLRKETRTRHKSYLYLGYKKRGYKEDFRTSGSRKLFKRLYSKQRRKSVEYNKNVRPCNAKELMLNDNVGAFFDWLFAHSEVRLTTECCEHFIDSIVWF